MIIERIEDMSAVKSFMTKPEIFRYAGEHNADPKFATVRSNDYCFWLSFKIDGETVGMTSFYRTSGCAVEFHPYILRAYKGLYNEMVSQIFEWFAENMPDKYIKINAVIPVIHKGAINAAIEAGMTQEGVDRMSYITESGACDRINYGITREEIVK